MKNNTIRIKKIIENFEMNVMHNMCIKYRSKFVIRAINLDCFYPLIAKLFINVYVRVYVCLTHLYKSWLYFNHHVCLYRIAL